MHGLTKISMQIAFSLHPLKNRKSAPVDIYKKHSDMSSLLMVKEINYQRLRRMYVIEIYRLALSVLKIFSYQSNMLQNIFYM